MCKNIVHPLLNFQCSIYYHEYVFCWPYSNLIKSKNNIELILDSNVVSINGDNKEVYIWADIPCDGYNGEYLTVRVETISGWESYKRTYNLTNGQYYSVITAYSVETDNKVIAVEMVFSNVPNGANYIELSYYTYEDSTDHNYYWKITKPNPTITSQPTISSINPTSGASTIPVSTM